jgi:peptidoglycan/xylan/chitin deacetylase (PgdA/CDA1 family)
LRPAEPAAPEAASPTAAVRQLSGREASGPDALDPLGLDRYGQMLVLDFPDEASARAVSVTAAVLYRDSKWAITQRWDDNLVDSLRVRDLLNRHYMHGTFYMNASDAWYSNESHYPFNGDLRQELGKALMKGGHSIGGHTLTHNYVPDLNRDEMFWETLGVRMDREVNTQSPVVSFVFPFTTFENAFEARTVHGDIAELLKRGGYMHVANQFFNMRLDRPTGMLDSWLLPCDSEAPIDPAIRKLLNEEKQREKEPVMCFCMHAWPAKWGGPAFPKLDAEFKHWRGRSVWWYAQANELAAYRYQQIHGGLQVRVDGRHVIVAVERFEPWDLGDPIALTLKLTGGPKAAPTAMSAGQALKPYRGRDKQAWLVDLPQAPGHGLPTAYDWHRNHSNKASGLEEKGKGVISGLASRLWVDGGQLRLRLENRGAELGSVRVTWRLPLGWAQPPRMHRQRLAHGEALDLALDLVPEGTPLLHQGRFFAAAQVDALRGGERLRLYSDVRDAPAPRDPSYPKGGFAVMGPLPADRDDFDEGAFARRILGGRLLKPCETPFEGESACWQESPPAMADPLHPEIIPAGGLMAPRTFYTWDSSVYYPLGHKLHYLLASDVYSPRTRTAKLLFPKGPVRRLLLNGRRVKGRSVTLKAGRNRLLMDYAAGTADAEGQANFSEKNYGPYFRLMDEQGLRLLDIRYQVPPGLTTTAAATPATTP